MHLYKKKTITYHIEIDSITDSNYYEIYYMMIELEEHQNLVQVKRIFELLLHSKSINKI